MPLAREAGYTNYLTDGSKFIPEIWSTNLVKKWYPKSVLTYISNTDYEGEIKDKGSKVHIRTRPTVTITKGTVGGKINYEQLTSPGIELEIDQYDHFAFKLADVDKYQSDLAEMEKWADETTNAQRISVERTVLSSVYTDVATANQGVTAGAISGGFNLGSTAAPFTLTKANIIDWIVDASTVLGEQNVSHDDDCFMILPEWACGMIEKSELKDASITGDSKSILRSGMIGKISRFNIWASNLVHQGTGADAGKFYPIFGHKSGLTFATQFANMEDLRIQDEFGTFYRGQQLYGFKVINDTVLGSGCINKA